MIFEDHPSPKKLSDQENPSLVHYFSEELKSVYGIEKELLEQLGRFQKQAFGDEFKNMLVKYSQLTISNIERMEKIFLLADIPVSAHHSPTLLGMTEEVKNISLSTEPSHLIDLKLSAITARFNFLNICQYTQLHSLAHRMQLKEVTSYLKENLDAEQTLCENLSLCIIKDVINRFPGIGGH